MFRRLSLSMLISVAGLAAGPVQAGDPAPFPEFTFKRVKVPKPGTAGRITVQIDPSAPKPDAPAAKPSKPEQGTLAYDWYWDTISPALRAATPGRLNAAVVHLDKGSVPTPRVQTLQGIVQNHGVEILKATIGTKVSPAFVLAVISVESAGRSDAVSSAGATGLMQLIPATAERFGVTDATDPAQNIAGGVKYLDWLMGQFDNDAILVLAGYNAGENAVRKNDGVPPYNETRGYVPKVLAAWAVARAMCLTPPELISDGCAFGQFKVAGDG